MRTVVVIASSSRGGSSVTAAWLRQSRQLLHFRAEVNPFFHLAGLQSDSDYVPADAPTQRLWTLMRPDIGRPGPYDPDAFARDLHARFRLQWVDRRFRMDEVRRALPSPPVDATFHRTVFERLGIPAGYYDLPAQAPVPQGPFEPVLEEPPLVCIEPWEWAADIDRPLIIKTPSLAYRLPYLRRLFAGWRLKVLHLVRAAPDAINGLVDGWNYPNGFFSHRLDLAIPGYSEVHPWGDWWNYDLPPGWQAWTRQPLVEVCGWQWRSAHEHILRFNEADDWLTVKFEDLLGGKVRPVLDWLGVEREPALDRGFEELPPVMATSPRARRWFERADALDPALNRPDTAEMMKRLGY